MKVIETEGDEIVKDMPQIVETFEMRELKALSFLSFTNLLVPSSEMNKDDFKVTIGGHGVDELLGAYTAWKELKN